MSDRMTSIYLASLCRGRGWAEWGRKTPAEMIAIIRDHARRDKEAAEAILAAPDEAFTVETYVGVHVRRDRKVLQAGKQDASNA